MKNMNQANQPAGVSSVVRKFLMALSGLALVGFVIVHLLGNLTLYRPTGAAFNLYAEKLHSLGGLLVAAEIGLLLVAVLHVLTGFGLKKTNLAARPERYKMWRSKNGPVPSNVSSRNMIVTGVVLLIFLVIHIWQFRFGAGMEQGYVVDINGEQARDLHRLIVETFKNPLYVLFYVGSMTILGMHLRHGIWSGFQSLGLVHGTASRRLITASAVTGFVLSVGFLFIPVYIYFFV